MILRLWHVGVYCNITTERPVRQDLLDRGNQLVVNAQTFAQQLYEKGKTDQSSDVSLKSTAAVYCNAVRDDPVRQDLLDISKLMVEGGKAFAEELKEKGQTAASTDVSVKCDQVSLDRDSVANSKNVHPEDLHKFNPNILENPGGILFIGVYCNTTTSPVRQDLIDDGSRLVEKAKLFALHLNDQGKPDESTIVRLAADQVTLDVDSCYNIVLESNRYQVDKVFQQVLNNVPTIKI
ncbi:unnamed protein product [Oppiella nova]|uniref:Uncharacterized protein n=1 Tax=Oppiella nova TaxID=334625 RepID=A0A7R9QK89_9ACAR|nr:unnamed protein product [Oppiella nova]CAG2167503.1 unnamed protein product [Oppiella nova]